MEEPASKKPRTKGPEDESSEEEDSEEGSSDSQAGDEQVTLSFGGDDSTAVVIWMHGLGDTPSGWAETSSEIREKLPHTKWILPCAPEHPVTCNGGEISTSWMDLVEIPITSRTPDNGRDLPESLDIVHTLIDHLVSKGMPANRIVLGGFSQGAALAIVAALKYPKKLAGACMLSGWCLRKQDWPSLTASSANKTTPVLICHGDADTTVFPGCGRLAKKTLEDVGTPVEFHAYPNMSHGSCEDELNHLTAFLKRVVP